MSILSNVYQVFLDSQGVNTDSRSLKEGEIFIALKGDNFNGNQFVEGAIKKGAAAVICDEPPSLTHHKIFVVDDALIFLQTLANHHRKQVSAKIIGITGSNGKTTTKELMRDVLSTTYITQATIGNLNNHIGVPLTLLKINAETNIAIVEMGANHQKEIEVLCKIAEPDFGYITNFGKAHLEGFGGIEGVIKGKSELYDYIRSSDGTVIIDNQDAIQVDKSIGINQISFGNTSSSSYKISDITENEFVELAINGVVISTKLIGQYNFKNAAAAAAFGLLFNVDVSNIKFALENYESKMNRSELRKTEQNELILDAYNANPSSMTLSIENFRKLNQTSKLLILGDMFELGNFSREEHQNIVNLIEESNLNAFLVGEEFSKTKSNSNITKFSTLTDIKNYLIDNQVSGHSILLKGSRGMQLEQLIPLL